MKKKIPLSYRTIQRIKAEEYERFFSQMPGYYIYLNHLGEIRWMTEEEALKQHEFFYYSQSALECWKRRIKLKQKIDLSKLTDAEKELRLHFRILLEKKYLGEIQPETAKHIPSSWKYEMNDEELENIPIPSDLGGGGVWKKLLINVGILAAIAIISYFWFAHSNRPQVGKLLVKSDIVGARIYLDEVDFLGYTNKIINNVPAGLHRISAIKGGYISFPKYHEVEIMPDSLITLEFVFKPARSDVQGYLKIVAEQKNSKIFVDNNYYGFVGDQPVLVLEEGQHTINIQKQGYVTVPAEKVVYISAGDTSILIVEQVPLSKDDSRPIARNKTGMGTIEVTSNIKDARIFLNGRDTGYETDYVFTKMPPGKYVIEVRKDGYSVEPQKEEIILKKNNLLKNVHFTLTREFERVKILTAPMDGPIYIDGEFKGEGKFEGVLKIGEHKVSFGDLKGYKTPRTRQIQVKPGAPVSIEVSYFPLMRIAAYINHNGNIVAENCEVFTGYTLSTRTFTASKEGGPNVEFNEKLNDYVWKLGYAFAYRNPKGNDAIKIVFKLPRDLNYDQKFIVRMLAASSRDKYPLSLSTKVDISITINNTKLDYYYKPKFLEDIGGLELVEWDVTSFVKPGPNSFVVSTTDDNNTFYYVKRVEIFN